MAEISDVRVWPFKSDTGSTVAFGDFVLAGAAKIKFSIKKGTKGLFVGFPGKFGEKPDPKTGKKVWYSDVTITDEDTQRTLSRLAITEYQKKTGQSDMHQGEPSGPTSQVDDNIPF